MFHCTLGSRDNKERPTNNLTSSVNIFVAKPQSQGVFVLAGVLVLFV